MMVLRMSCDTNVGGIFGLVLLAIKMLYVDYTYGGKTVAEFPKIYNGPNVREVFLEETIKFPCDAWGIPPPVLSWSFNKRKIEGSTQVKIRKEGRILQIQVLSYDMEGQYCCLADNGLRIKDKICGVLHIKKAPKVSLVPNRVSTFEGSIVRFHCVASGRPPPLVFWYHNNKPISCLRQIPQLSEKVLTTNVSKNCSHIIIEGNYLTLHGISEDNIGHYQCSAWNYLGTVMSSNAYLDLKFSYLVFKATAPAFEAGDIYDIHNFPSLAIAVVIAIIGVTLTIIVVFWYFSSSQFFTNCKYSKDTSVTNESTNSSLENCETFFHSQDILHDLDCSNMKFNLVREIGEGAFGKVYEAKSDVYIDKASERTVRSVAIKTLHNINLGTCYAMYREAVTLHSFAHPNIVQLLGINYKNIQRISATNKTMFLGNLQPPFLVFEYIDGGDLCTFLRDLSRNSCKISSLCNGKLTKLDICIQIGSGMKYLADRDFIHRDLATRNCLISSEGLIKIADFGLSRKVCGSDYYKTNDSEFVPVRWMAPESLTCGRYSMQTDVWAYGITIWEIYTNGMQPYFGLTNRLVIEAILEGNVLPKPISSPLWLYNLMRLCWSLSAKDRPDFDMINLVLAQFEKDC